MILWECRQYPGRTATETNLLVLNAPLIAPILNKIMMPLMKRKVNTVIENEEKFIPNGIDLRLRFNRISPSFCMMTVASSSGKLSIHSMLLWVRKIRPTPTVLNADNQRLNTETAKYPLRGLEMKTFTIATGTKSKIDDHLFKGQMPERIVVGLVTNDAFNGEPTKIPFNF